MKLLITGASGIIGRQVAQAALAAREGEVFLAGRRELALPGAQFYQVDLSAPEAAETLIRDIAPTHIIHTAWETRPGVYWDALSNLRWAEATTRMAIAFGETGGRRFVQAGSCAEYDWSSGTCIEDVTPDRPATRYGIAKLAAFLAIQAAAYNRFSAVEGRIFFVYGPDEAPMRFVPTICRSLLAGKVPELGSGRQIRDFLHTKDIGRALYMLAMTDAIEGTVNIADGCAVSLSEIAHKLAEIAGATKTGLGLRPDRPGDPDRLAASAEKLRSIGWKPTVPLDKGLKDTFDWWRSHAEILNA